MQSRVEPVPLGRSHSQVPPCDPAARTESISCRARFADGSDRRMGSGPPQFVITIDSPAAWEALLRSSAFGAALRFMRGDYDISGDVVAAIRFWEQQWKARWFTPVVRTAGRILSKRPESWLQTRTRARRNIAFHYNRCNDFYRLFLDERMVYSCAYFEHADATLADAQLAKLDHICRKLEVRPGARFLDVGSGWGALVLRAAERFGADATGCTLSDRQYDESLQRRDASPAAARVSFLHRDYRELNGRFDAIASVGMFEHVGRHRLHGYFRQIASLLEPEGKFLNHGIVRAAGMADDPSTRFIQQRVFPGGELTTLEHVLQEAERAGMEPVDVENLRPHYALTCRRWVQRLEEQRDACVRLVGEETYRTWRLYLAGSAMNFEDGNLGVYQVLFARRGAPRRQLTREYMLPTAELHP